MPVEDWPIFVRYGSILPLLNVHEGPFCLSLEACYNNTLTLTIWGRNAQGLLYVDDGLQLPVKGNLFSFKFSQGILSVACFRNELPKKRTVISAIKIYGLAPDELGSAHTLTFDSEDSSATLKT